MVRIEAIELLEDPLLLAQRDAQALVADGEPHGVGVGLHPELDAPTLRRVLDRVVDEVGQHLARALGVAGHLRQHRGNRHVDRRVASQAQPCRRGRRPDELLGIERLGDDTERAAVELAGEQDFLHEAGEPLRLDRDHVEQVVPGLLVQVLLPLEQRHRGAVQRGQRRAQLVRDRGDELGTELLEPPLAGHIAEGVHDAVAQGGAEDGKPDLPSFDLQRHGLGARRVVRVAGTFFPRQALVARGAGDHAARAAVANGAGVRLDSNPP